MYVPEPARFELRTLAKHRACDHCNAPRFSQGHVPRPGGSLFRLCNAEPPELTGRSMPMREKPH